jgi:hypothetical protein
VAPETPGRHPRGPLTPSPPPPHTNPRGGRDPPHEADRAIRALGLAIGDQDGGQHGRRAPVAVGAVDVHLAARAQLCQRPVHGGLDGRCLGRVGVCGPRQGAAPRREAGGTVGAAPPAPAAEPKHKVAPTAGFLGGRAGPPRGPGGSYTATAPRSQALTPGGQAQVAPARLMGAWQLAGHVDDGQVVCRRQHLAALGPAADVPGGLGWVQPS